MDFKDVLYELQSNSKELKTFDFPLSQKFFYINLNTRKIEAPENLSVRFDHNAETVFFVVDRYFDTVDLTKQNWIVQYQNANPDKTKRTYLYYPSYYSLAENDTKIIFPWVIEGAATAYSGDVFFAVRFYTLNSNKEFIYNLNTIPSSSKVLYGMDATGEVSDYIYEADPAQDIINRLITIEDKISNLGTGGDISQEDILNLNKRIDDLEEIINNLDYGNIDPQEIIEIKNKLNNLEVSIKDLEEIPNEVENLKSSYNSLSEELLKISQKLDIKVDSNVFADFLIDLNSSLESKVDVETYDDDHLKINSNISQLQEEINNLKENGIEDSVIEEINTTISTLETNINNFSIRLATAEQKIENLSNIDTTIYWEEND